MNIFVSHSSALEFWRASSWENMQISRAKPQTGDVPEVRVLNDCDFAAYGIESRPLHVTVLDAGSRGQSKQVVCHTYGKNNTAESFVRLSDGLYVSSPEACFLQLAYQLSVVDLVAVGLELCGTYAVCGKDIRGFRKNQSPMTVASLRRYLSKATNCSGAGKARRALKYLADASASPMETMLVMLLCLPSSLGGYGLELPKLNQRVESSASKVGRSRSYYCDLFWPRAKLAIEYDSDMFHTDSRRIADDAQRRIELSRLGVTVVSVTRRQVFDARAFDEAARAVAKSLGKRLRSTYPDIMTRRYALRKHLLEKMCTQNSNGDRLPRGDYVDW